MVPGFGDIYATDLNGRTPLHCACASASFEAIKYLIYHGSDPSEPDRFGKVCRLSPSCAGTEVTLLMFLIYLHIQLPLDFARSRGDENIIQFIESVTDLYKSSITSPQSLASRENRIRSNSASVNDIEENITLPVLRTMKQVAANSTLIVLPEDVTPGKCAYRIRCLRMLYDTS